MKLNHPNHIVYICTGSKCEKKGAKDCYKKCKKIIKNARNKDVEVIRTECTDRCKMAPIACLQPQNKWMISYKQDEVLEMVLHLVEKKF